MKSRPLLSPWGQAQRLLIRPIVFGVAFVMVIGLTGFVGRRKPLIPMPLTLEFSVELIVGLFLFFVLVLAYGIYLGSVPNRYIDSIQIDDHQVMVRSENYRIVLKTKDIRSAGTSRLLGHLFRGKYHRLGYLKVASSQGTFRFYFPIHTEAESQALKERSR